MNLPDMFKEDSNILYRKYKRAQQAYYDLQYQGISENTVQNERSMEDPQSWDCIHAIYKSKVYQYMPQQPGTFLV